MKTAKIELPRGTKMKIRNREYIYVRPARGPGHWMVNPDGKLELIPTIIFETYLAAHLEKHPPP